MNRQVRRLAAERRRALEAALDYENLRQNADEFRSWIAEKQKLANDESYRDIASIANKLLRHEAFEAELKANAPRVGEKTFEYSGGKYRP